MVLGSCSRNGPCAAVQLIPSHPARLTAPSAKPEAQPHDHVEVGSFLGRRPERAQLAIQGQAPQRRRGRAVNRFVPLLALPLLIGAGPAQVIDGDTLDLAGERIRLIGIDAPEGNQTCQRNGRPWECGDDATAALGELVAGAEVHCNVLGRDRWGRGLAVWLRR
ncbi:MAG: thermonuclease family protein [Geminicoccales bacterium]